MHSHLLPGLDDGVGTMEEAEALVRGLVDLGYTKIITTPHVMSDAFRNTPEMILSRLDDLKAHLRERHLTIPITAAAEYYLDEALMTMLEMDKELLTFGDRYLLFETNFMTEPFNLKEFIFLATTKGYRLILAHPERYLYLQNDLTKVQDLLDRGVMMQLNVNSITGHYSKPAQLMAGKLIDKGMIHWIGSDCHHREHIEVMKRARRSRYFRKALTLPLMNNSLS